MKAYEIKGNTREGMLVHAKNLHEAIDHFFEEHRIIKVIWKMNLASISYNGDDEAVMKINLPYAEVRYTITNVGDK